MADLEPGGISSSETIGSTRSKGCIRSWLPYNWHKLRNMIYGISGIPSAETIGNPYGIRTFNRQIINVGNIASSSAYGSVIVHEPSEIWSPSPEYADVLATINAAPVLSTVRVPAGAGTATWPSMLIITKGVQVIGPGVGALTITKGHTDAIMLYNPANPDANYPFRFSGFSFDCTANGGPGLRMYTASNTAQTSIRIDHNRVVGASAFLQSRLSELVTGGNFYGVVDNNYAEILSTANAMSWIGTVGQGMWNWVNREFVRGSADMMFFEDNTFICRSFLGDCGMGMRYCARYNNVTCNSTIFQAVFDCHGNQMPSGHTGGMGLEIYHNTLNAGGVYTQFLDHRGGRCMCFYNTINNAANIDMNCREEIIDNYNAEVAPFSVVSAPDIYAERGQPMHPSGSYFFENRRGTGELIARTGGGIDYTGEPEIWCFDGEATVPTEDRHFWQQKTPFDGSSGVGVGTLAARPASCTCNGAAWWATDESRLYRWRTGTGWELFYTPYTYPHPLRGE